MFIIIFFVNCLRFNVDSSLLRKHRSHHQADAQGNLAVSICRPYCLGQHICRMRNVNYDEYQTCVDALGPRIPDIPDFSQPPRPTNPPAVPGTGSRWHISIMPYLLIGHIVVKSLN